MQKVLQAGWQIFIIYPYLIFMYNKGMGGVNILVALYRCNIKKQKYWFGFVPWSMNCPATVNAWCLRNMVFKAHGIAFRKPEYIHTSYNILSPFPSKYLSQHHNRRS
jgi:hypothetical protein